MATLEMKYGTEAQAITITLASLGNGSVRASTVVDNTTNLFLDALVQLQLKSGASGVSASGFVNVYAYGTVDFALPLYPEGITGTDGAITLTVPTNLKPITSINMVANATSYTSEPFLISAAFGGVMPSHWGIVVENQSGGAFDTTEGNHLKFYQGILGQSV